ncbi:MAG: hypothetical protein JNM80_11715 [Phycisphaerae bacterium]|nr:hypothetical protein [Phycisphaerae bacterium]
MSVHRGLSMAILGVLATVWAGALVIAGLWLVFDGPRTLPVSPLTLRSAGAASIAGGGLVFMVLVADRLFPSVGRRMSMWLVEMAGFAAFALGVAGCVLGALGGTS